MRRIRAMRWILGALVVAFLAAGCGGGDSASPTAMTGELVKVNAYDRTIEVKGAVGEKGLYHLDEATKIMSGGTVIEFGDLANGSQVVIDAEAKGGDMVATTVEVVGD